ncbi:MAG: ribosome silencing factor [Kiritimatiellae bacterium]|nr:ribosome silencing factor [Kiritimatiellia bacterium]
MLEREGAVINSQQIADEVVKALEEKQALDIRVFDVREGSNITDFYVVASGNSAPHLKALLSEAGRHMKSCDVQTYRSSGESDSGWVVIDFLDVVLHVFSPEARAYYAIEKLWEK